LESFYSGLRSKLNKAKIAYKNSNITRENKYRSMSVAIFIFISSEVAV
jgi:hypothetical protein